MHDRLRKALATVSSLPAIVSVGLITLYQRLLSPDHSPLRHLYPYGFCRHEPTCSSFAIEVLQTRSLPIAYGLIAKRMLSCHPWQKPSDERLRVVIAREP